MKGYSITFDPLSQGLDLTTLLFAILGVVGLLSLCYLLRTSSSGEKSKSIIKVTLAIGVSMVLAIAAYYSFATNKMGQVVLTQDSITTPFGKCELKFIKDAYLYKATLPDPNSKNTDDEVKDSISYLLIEEFSGKTHALSEKTYDINTILKELKKQLAEKI